MAYNPLESTPEREARIRERARVLWEADGRPKGREAEYRERAQDLLAIEENAHAGLRANPAANGAASREGIEEAEIQENYGEIPGRLTDQGERRQTPYTHKELHEREKGNGQPRLGESSQ